MNTYNLRWNESVASLTNYKNEIAKMKKKYTHKTWLIGDLTKNKVFCCCCVCGGCLFVFCLLLVQCTQATLRMFNRY